MPYLGMNSNRNDSRHGTRRAESVRTRRQNLTSPQRKQGEINPLLALRAGKSRFLIVVSLRGRQGSLLRRGQRFARRRQQGRVRRIDGDDPRLDNRRRLGRRRHVLHHLIIGVWRPEILWEPPGIGSVVSDV